jgi:hypothetical protein
VFWPRVDPVLSVEARPLPATISDRRKRIGRGENVNARLEEAALACDSPCRRSQITPMRPARPPTQRDRRGNWRRTRAALRRMSAAAGVGFELGRQPGDELLEVFDQIAMHGIAQRAYILYRQVRGLGNPLGPPPLVGLHSNRVSMRTVRETRRCADRAPLRPRPLSRSYPPLHTSHARQRPPRRPGTRAREGRRSGSDACAPARTPLL